GEPCPKAQPKTSSIQLADLFHQRSHGGLWVGLRRGQGERLGALALPDHTRRRRGDVPHHVFPVGDRQELRQRQRRSDESTVRSLQLIRPVARQLHQLCARGDAKALRFLGVELLRGYGDHRLQSASCLQLTVQLLFEN